MKLVILNLLVQILLLFYCNIALAQNSSDYAVSPNKPWNDISEIPDDGDIDQASILRSIIMYIPNRFLDLIDIVKADVGVGPSFGAVMRITKYGQIGARTFMPMSARVGLLGRRAPAMIETDTEIGFGSVYKKSHKRSACWGEVGAGADLFVAGAYLGLCPDELIDFIGGIFLFDLKDDDLK